MLKHTWSVKLGKIKSQRGNEKQRENKTKSWRRSLHGKTHSKTGSD
jgi:hypothetical protein